MKFCIIIPAHNEELFIGPTLTSLVNQSLPPSEIIIVNDNSSDGTKKVIDKFREEHHIIKSIENKSSDSHLPGTKIINAFKRGLAEIKEDYDIICKFDADLIFPPEYLSALAIHFQKNKNLGMAAGICEIKEKDIWVTENLTRKDHIRGALKAYRRKCFQDIGGLKSSIGWDTVDELLALYYGWEILVDPELKVKHLKPTGQSYSKKSDHLQGEAFYKLRYGLCLTLITALKMSIKKKNSRIFYDYLKGFRSAKKNNLDPLVDKDQGKFIRKLRWKGIKEKLL